jgi:hypothetical protein
MTVLSCGIFDRSISFFDEIRASVETSHGEICSKLLVLSVLHRQIQIIHLTENMKTIPMPSTIEEIRLERFKSDLIVPQTRAKEKIHRLIWMIEN